MDIMLDIETLGTKPGCVILSIGALAFEPDVSPLPTQVPIGTPVYLPDNKNTGRVFYQNLTIWDQLLLGLEIDPKTLDWWRAQSDEAKTALTHNPITLKGGLSRLITWLANLPIQGEGRSKVWANSPDFDCAIIEHAAKLLNIIIPWTFRDKADLRTLKHVTEIMCKPPLDTPPPVRSGVHHNALDDCYYQAATVQYMIRNLRNGTA